MRKLIPVRFDGYMHSGGSTKPWKVVSITEGVPMGNETVYVVKIFTSNNISQAPSVAKEFICNALATEFDLSVPSAALINPFDESFVNTLSTLEREHLQDRHQGVTFACELLDVVLVNDALKSNIIHMSDIATLFAFDCLILNTDRGGYRNKPNLLQDDDGFILIDHELSLSFIDDEDKQAFNHIVSLFEQNTWHGVYEKHLFYPRLKSYKGPKKTLFDTFEEFLMNLNIGKIETLITELKENDIEVGATDYLIEYLRILKQQANKFKNILLGIIA